MITLSYFIGLHSVAGQNCISYKKIKQNIATANDNLF